MNTTNVSSKILVRLPTALMESRVGRPGVGEEKYEEKLMQKINCISKLKSNTSGTDAIETRLMLWH